MTWPHATHRIETDDLVALGSDEFSAQTIRFLRAAQLSKHFLMLEALRRRTGTRLIQAACDVLSDVQERAPEVVDELIGSPQLGFWAANCLARLPPVGRRQNESVRPTTADLAQISAFAAVVALRVGYPFELAIPVRCGTVILPTLGTARLASRRYTGWARIKADRCGATIRSEHRAVSLSAVVGNRYKAADPAWIPAKRLTATAAGISLSIVLETDDPYLTRLSSNIVTDTHPYSPTWQERIEAAWQILTAHHRPVASHLAESVTTLIPLRAPGAGDVVAATSGWAWGAVWLNLPASSLRLAEALVHEFNHLVLAATEELTPLVHDDGDRLYYVSWRDDPRPSPAVLQGTFAHLGVAGFWRRQRRVESGSIQFRADVEFARARSATLRGAQSLIDSGVLTKAGEALVRSMLVRLEEWQREPVRIDAESAAAEIAAEHRLRWRLAHVRPSAATVDDAAHAWLAGGPKIPLPPGNGEALRPFVRHIKADLARLLEINYRESPTLGSVLAETEANSGSEAAFLSGHYADAKDGYVRRIQEGEDDAAWIGLLLTLRHTTRSTQPVTVRPEVLVAVYDRIREIADIRPDPEALVTWITASPDQLRVHRSDIEIQATTLRGAA